MDNTQIKKTYLKEPSLDDILSFVNLVGVSYAHFEAYYGMAEGTIKNVKYGSKKLAVRYWPIFYERIVPQYGSLNNFKKPIKKSVPKLVPNTKTEQSTKKDFHGRLNNIK